MFHIELGRSQSLFGYTIPSDVSHIAPQICGLLLCISLAYHFFLLDKDNNSPALVKGWFPFIGTSFSVLREPERFLLECKARYGDIFTLYMCGHRIHIVCDPFSGIPSIYKDGKSFSISAVTDAFCARVYGQCERALKDTELSAAIRSLFVSEVMAQEKVDSLMTQFNANLQKILKREIKKLDPNGELCSRDGVVVNLDTWLKAMMFECSGKALFGDTWPNDSEFFNDFCEWDDGLYSLLVNIPAIFTRKTKAARERYIGRLLQMLKAPLENASSLVQERIKLDIEHGYPIEDTVRSFMAIAFALQTNAIPASFWLIAYLAGLKDAAERDNLEDHLQKHTITSDCKETIQFNVPELLQDPLLNGALSETLRLQANGLVPRAVEQDTTVSVAGQTYSLRKGDTVIISMAGVHKNPNIYDDPEEFRLGRFIPKNLDGTQAKPTLTKDGVQVKAPYVWWGGGQYMCTGRKFAVAEIILFASTILQQFEITSLNGGIPELPATPPVRRYGGGMEFPGKRWAVRLRYRRQEK